MILIVPLQTITNENQSTSKLSKNPERWTSNMVRNINDLCGLYVIFILDGFEAYLILIWISQKDADVAALPETKNGIYIYVYRYYIT